MAKKAAAETPDFVEIGGIRWPVLSAEAMAAVCGFSSDFLRQLERAGRFKKLGRDRYSSREVLTGYIAHLKDEERRSTKSAEARRVLEARAREIEIRNAMREGRLIEADDLAEHVAMIVGAFRSELAGVPAAATRDLALRAAIERPIEDAITRMGGIPAGGWDQWGSYAARLADERLATLETSLAGAPTPGESVARTAYEYVKATMSKPRTRKRATR